MLLKRAIQTYLLECAAAGLSKTTLHAYRYGLGRLFVHIGNRRLEKIKRADLIHWLADLREEKQANGKTASAATLNQCFRTAHSFFRWSLNQELITSDPLSGVRAPKLEHKIRPHLSLENMPKFIDALAHSKYAARDQSLGMLLIDTGLRLDEIVALTVSDVDTVKRVVAVTKGKGGKGRFVPFSSTALGVLKLWLIVRPPTLKTLFGLSRKGIQTTVRRAAIRAGVKVSVHGLRHTFATHYDGPLDDLQRILGHADITTTIDIYRHSPDPATLQEHDTRSPLAVMRRARAIP